MSYRHTLEAALESLHEIEDLINTFPQNGQIPAVEIDLALQKLRNAYELMLMIRDKDKNTDGTAPGTIKSESAPTGEVREVTIEEKSSVSVAVTVEDQKDNKSTETVLEEVASVRKTRSTKEVQTLSDQFKGRTTLLESLHHTYEESETLANARPVIDLMAAIGINDRFSFIRELFNNDKKDFEGTIAILNEAGSYNNAYNYLVNQFNWDMDGEAVQLLLNIIRRKYITGRNE